MRRGLKAPPLQALLLAGDGEEVVSDLLNLGRSQNLPLGEASLDLEAKGHLAICLEGCLTVDGDLTAQQGRENEGRALVPHRRLDLTFDEGAGFVEGDARHVVRHDITTLWEASDDGGVEDKDGEGLAHCISPVALGPGLGDG